MYLVCNVAHNTEITMATVSESLARQIIANDGYYADDPRVHQVITYDNAFDNNRSWAILYECDVLSNRYAPSPYVQNVKVEWEKS